ncbi:MAG: DUF480 domain-containing protein [Actinomycetia bacterium]|nr:DUF480 domain-containing protein [Actinomycetes bacterium]MCP5031521.1 DUF480 domain-containing protein [Actinomycetes bacterium]
MTLDQLFIYGTLIPGEDRWPLLEDFITALESDTTRGRLFDGGVGYPAARFDGTGTIPDRIHGLRMTIDPEVLDDCLDMLDEIEGAGTGLYHRVVIETDSGRMAWAYQYGFGLGQLTPIRSGSWTEHVSGTGPSDGMATDGADEAGPTCSKGAEGDGSQTGGGSAAVAQNLLSFVESRVIGALIEKGLSTPQNYPLSLNALVAACNQATSRDPVTDLSERDVLDILTEGKERKLVRFVHPRSGRGVTKYRHVLDEYLGLEEPDVALLAVLMLRGLQTARELRDRTERMHDFGHVEAVEEALGTLATAGHVTRLERQLGQRDERWMHLLSSGRHP